MNYLVFFSWLIATIFFISRIRFVRKAGLGTGLVIALFICNVAAGVVGGFITEGKANTDTWNYHADALKEYRLLFTHPAEYFSNLFYTGYSDGYHGLLQTQNSYWNDLKTNLIIKLVSVFDVFSGGNYYTNVVLYNFLIFFGHIGLYRVFSNVYKTDKRLLAIALFLLPSLLFYGSTIHKDGLMLAAIGVIVFNVYQLLNQKGAVIIRLLYIFTAFVIVFLFRNFIAAALLPALAAWIISSKKKYSPIIVFISMYLMAVFLFFTIGRVLPAVSLPAYMAQKQADFFALEKGNTTIPLTKLEASAGSYLQVLPQALQHSLLRPFVTDVKLSTLLLPLSIELLFYELLILAYFFFKKRESTLNEPFALFGLFFGLSVCIIIGYTVPVIGAIVRYRSIYLPFLLAPFLFNIDWKRLPNRLFNYKIV